ncbi:very short patch repair endonuclease [uncultured Hymenobacter sp.]|uniref:very short patch repair endonuclease n=1 Tax=uncultured Hymenobacter sp. TaxID=170016 RepID=UPI0035CC073B
MTRKLAPSARRAIMSKVRSKDTKPEMLVRQYLHGQGFRYRLYRADLPGKPDLVLPKYGAVIFVHGCFWHQHNCGKNITPAHNTTYWTAKLQRNVSRDVEAQKSLQELGWRVIVVWECELKQAARGATLAWLTSKLLVDEMPHSWE